MSSEICHSNMARFLEGARRYLSTSFHCLFLCSDPAQIQGFPRNLRSSRSRSIPRKLPQSVYRPLVRRFFWPYSSHDPPFLSGKRHGHQRKRNRESIEIQTEFDMLFALQRYNPFFSCVYLSSSQRMPYRPQKRKNRRMIFGFLPYIEPLCSSKIV